MWGSKLEAPHLENKGVPEQPSVLWVPEQEVQKPLHHPGPVGLSGVHSGRHHHGLLVLAVRPGCDSHHIHGIPSQAAAQHPQCAVRGHRWVGRDAPKVALQVRVGVGVTVGQVAGVCVVREPESPGEWIQGRCDAVVLCVLKRDIMFLKGDPGPSILFLFCACRALLVCSSKSGNMTGHGHLYMYSAGTYCRLYETYVTVHYFQIFIICFRLI